MDLSEIIDAIGQRLGPGPVPADGPWNLLALAVAALAVVVPPLWQLLRPGVTIVHELGRPGRDPHGQALHRLRRLRHDMSRHAVTVGPRRGIGRILDLGRLSRASLLGALLDADRAARLARTALFAALCVLVLLLVFTRSGRTLLAVLASAAGIGALWWWGSPALTALLTLAAGVFLLLGAWRHLGAVARRGGRQDDPGQLAQLTPLPAALWTVSFALVIGLATWWAGTTLVALLR